MFGRPAGQLVGPAGLRKTHLVNIARQSHCVNTARQGHCVNTSRHYRCVNTGKQGHFNMYVCMYVQCVVWQGCIEHPCTLLFVNSY